MYLIGTFNREYFGIGNDKNPMSLIGLVSKITKDHLKRTINDEDYQIINTTTMKYFDPKQNAWIKIKNF